MPQRKRGALANAPIFEKREPLLRAADRELAERDAEIDALARAGQRQRNGALRQDLRAATLDQSGIRLALGVVAEQVIGVHDVGELALAVVDAILAGSQ